MSKKRKKKDDPALTLALLGFGLTLVTVYMSHKWMPKG